MNRGMRRAALRLRSINAKIEKADAEVIRLAEAAREAQLRYERANDNLYALCRERDALSSHAQEMAVVDAAQAARAASEGSQAGPAHGAPSPDTGSGRRA